MGRVGLRMAHDAASLRLIAKIARALISFQTLKRAAALTLSVALILSPITQPLAPRALAPISLAKADTKDEIAQCLNIVGTAVTAAENISKAIANPEYVACMAEAASLNPVTIGAMAAVTALWATDTGAFNNPEECKGYLVGKLMGLVAQGLDSLIGDGSSFVAQMLESLIGQKGLDLIKQVAEYAGVDVDSEIATAKDEAKKEAMKKVKDLMGELAQALGPIMHSLNCGCSAAGTAAIIKNAAEGVAGAAGACADLLLNPGKLLDAMLDDPIGTLGAVGKAVCDGVAEVVDVCGAAKELYEFGKDLLEVACAIPGACAGLEAAYDTLKCFFSDCDTTASPPSKFEQQPCQVGVWQATDNPFVPYCSCPAPYGLISEKGYQYSSLYKKQEEYDGLRCDKCPPGYGRNSQGFCSKCDAGTTSDAGALSGNVKLQPGSPTSSADGSCSILYACTDGSEYKADNSGCFTCPAGTHTSPDHKSCWANCLFGQINNSTSGACECPLSIDGKQQMLLGPDFSYCGVPKDCPIWAPYNPKTQSCEPFCKNPYQVYKQPTGDVVTEATACQWCPDGQEAVGNECKPQQKIAVETTTVVCKDNKILVGGKCEECPYGTQRGAGNTCESVCPAGSAPKPQVSLPRGITGEFASGDIALGKGLQNPSAQDVASQAAGNLNKGVNTSPQPSTLADQICVKCQPNEQTQTSTIMGPGYAISETVCVACPKGEVSEPGGTCHSHRAFTIAPFNVRAPADRQRDDQRRRDTRPTPSKPESRTPPSGTEIDTKKLRAPSGTDAPPKTKLKCPPGQIPQNGECVTPRTAPQLSLPPMGGGSSAPGFGGGTRSPGAGGFSTTPVPRQQNNVNPKPF